MNLNEIFRKFAAKIAAIAGNAWAFIIAFFLIIVWGVSGPIFGFSTTWQLMVNTGTTIVTLLMVFLIQNTQNRDSRAIHIKLDEILKNLRGARNALIDIEDLPDEMLEELHNHFKRVAKKHSKQLKKETKKTKKKKKKLHFLRGLYSKKG